ncbi:MAG: DUF1592 domain-containing protein [Bryobacteraceae bacterium]
MWTSALTLAVAFAVTASGSDFDTAVKPLLTSYCIACHNAKAKAANLDLDRLRDPKAALAERDAWEKVAVRLRNGTMPPPPIPKPKPDAVRAAAEWADRHVTELDQSRKPDPGRVTARRLNRSEYNNTVRDLLGVNFRPADDFPLDDSGYGFDNIGDVLSLNPALMERYLKAADQIVRAAIVTGAAPKPVYDRYELERLGEPTQVPADPEADRLIRRGGLAARHRFSHPGEYELRVLLRGRGVAEDAASNLVLFVDGKPVHTIAVEPGQGKKRSFEARITAAPGEVEVGAAWAYPGPPERPVPTEPREPNDNIWVDALEVRGPFTVPETTSNSLFVCTPPPGAYDADCARKILAAFTRRAWRRPVADRELDRLVALTEVARKQGDSFAAGIQLAIKAVLVSPHFLFRIERDPAPGDPSAVHRLSDHELATRLSYFLWASMPDEELFGLADQDKLHEPAILDAQVARMLADPKSAGFAGNFAGQWLELRNLTQISPDPKKFPGFDADLREAMRRETLLFFEEVMRQDRPVTDFIDAPYSFLNERLAALYGIEGVTGRQFRRVALDGVQRSGIITQASVLTITSHPNRTSPVLRGIWLLENILASPPPPPPNDVPPLREDEIGTTVSLRKQMEKHRADPNCAVCHTKMDGLGFGLENYNPIGQWRTHDGSFEIDPGGELPGNRTFATPAEMKRILLGEKDQFTRCLAEKLTIFALGRGLESYDKPAIRSVVAHVAADQYRFSTLIREIVHSPAFQMRRGEQSRRLLNAAIPSGGPPP